MNNESVRPATFADVKHLINALLEKDKLDRAILEKALEELKKNH